MNLANTSGVRKHPHSRSLCCFHLHNNHAHARIVRFSVRTPTACMQKQLHAALVRKHETASAAVACCMSFHAHRDGHGRSIWQARTQQKHVTGGEIGTAPAVCVVPAEAPCELPGPEGALAAAPEGTGTRQAPPREPIHASHRGDSAQNTTQHTHTAAKLPCFHAEQIGSAPDVPAAEAPCELPAAEEALAAAAEGMGTGQVPPGGPVTGAQRGDSACAKNALRRTNGAENRNSATAICR